MINACKLKADKRAIALGELLSKRNLTEVNFEKWLLALVKSWQIKEPAEQDKKQRRWIDFACKEIENQFINDHFAESPKRNFELANIFDKRNHEDLTNYYNKLSLQSAEAGNDAPSLINGYDIQLRWLGRNQTQKNIGAIGSLLLKRKEVTEQFYHEAMAYFYTVSSALYIDNPNDKAYLEIASTKNSFLELRNTAKDSYNHILYLLAEARFNFYNRRVFENQLKEISRTIEDSHLDLNSKRYLERNCLYLKISGGLYYNFDIQSMIADAEKMFEIMLSYKIYDSVGYFLYLFLLLINKKLEQYDRLAKKYNTTFYSVENKDYFLFLESLRLYQGRKSEQAIANLLHTSYSHSLYVAAWSRLLEIKIHSEDGDNRLVKVLIDRAKRFLKTHKGNRLIYEPMMSFLLLFEDKKTQKTKAEQPKYFVYYS